MILRPEKPEKLEKRLKMTVSMFKSPELKRKSAFSRKNRRDRKNYNISHLEAVAEEEVGLVEQRSLLFRKKALVRTNQRKDRILQEGPMLVG